MVRSVTSISIGTLYVFPEDVSKTSLRRQKTLELKDESEDSPKKPAVRKRKTHEISVYNDDEDTPAAKKGKNFKTMILPTYKASKKSIKILLNFFIC